MKWNTHSGGGGGNHKKKIGKRGKRGGGRFSRSGQHITSVPYITNGSRPSFQMKSKKKNSNFFYRNKRSTSRGVNSFFCVFPLVREIRMLFKTQTNCTRHGISEMTFKVHWSNQNERKMGGGKEKSSASIIQPVIGVFIFPILLFIRGDHRSSIYARGKRETCRQGGPWSLYLT